MKSQLRTIALLAALAAFSLSTKAATNIFHVTGGNGLNYTIDGAPDPALTLVRGFTYEFRISVSASHPFFIRTVAGANYNDGVSAQGVTSGSIFFTVPTNAPNLKYQCGVHAGMTGPLNIVDPPTVSITDFSVGTNVVIQSTGTNILNLSVLKSTNLTTNTVWSATAIQSNLYANGTNTTQVALPAGEAVFFQVQQGFF